MIHVNGRRDMDEETLNALLRMADAAWKYAAAKANYTNALRREGAEAQSGEHDGR